MKTIPLTQGQVALVDDADYEWLSAFKWYALKVKSGGFYAVRQEGPRGSSTTRYMHRAICPEFPEVDHFNQNKLDNQRHNLRAATRSQNKANTGRYSTNTSGFKGVCWSKAAGKWQAQLRIKGRRGYLGCFSDCMEAARAYDSAAKENFGEFACLNFPEKQNDERNRPATTAPTRTLQGTLKNPRGEGKRSR